MKTKSLLSRTVQLAFGSDILTLLVVGTISYRGMVASSGGGRCVRHSQVRELRDEALKDSW